MKKILITGANSYIGTNLENWLKKDIDRYYIDTIDMKNCFWSKNDFSNYDVVFHVAGIAHVSSHPKMKELYYKVNYDLTIEVAKKAKAEGVKQFIFMSSIIVYGDSSSDKKIINKDTVPSPSNFYGESKLQAEKKLKLIETDKFKVVILRPPMVYGKNSKGNYNRLAKFVLKIPIFPNIDNTRSMIHIDNLCQFIQIIINKEESGLFFPQNKEYVNTSEMVKLIVEAHGKKIKLTKIFNGVIKLIGFKFSIVNKIFGNLVYDKLMSEYSDIDYQIRGLKESIKLSESRDYNG